MLSSDDLHLFLASSDDHIVHLLAPYRRLAMDEGWMSRHGGAVRILSYELLGFKNLLTFASHKSRVNSFQMEVENLLFWIPLFSATSFWNPFGNL